MNEERIKELFSDEEYVKSLVELGSYEAASAKLADDGVELSTEDLKKIVNIIKKKSEGEQSELSDEELEEIAGGFGDLISCLIVIGVLGGFSIIGSGSVIVATQRDC